MGFSIRNQSTVQDLEVMVSAYTKAGNDKWFLVPYDFNHGTSNWDRDGWELIAFRDPATHDRRGWYIDCKAYTVELTFYGFSQELGLVRK
ncbi:hypothetical protein GALMADRAFT_244842 [Galerina marginata CBS 339.88]|uniref:Uncharacterized protein n=1 Tax=Galerina marginata (strain CBS 339.88) TaxID=685588 RepID=A0A067T3X7_GALM3|nr:hypothetical protein GALMADRAFT_244842 [Galerina marginata CBS 339.88]